MKRIFKDRDYVLILIIFLEFHVFFVQFLFYVKILRF